MKALSNFATAASGMIHRVGFQLKKKSPEILVVAGLAGMVTSAVMACRATTKVQDIMNDCHDLLDSVKAAEENKELIESGKYSLEDAENDRRIIYVKTGFELVKLYAPSVILGGFSIGCVLASNNILRKRTASLAAAYAAVDKGFKEYRARVREEMGEEADKRFRLGVKAKKILETVIDPETGEETAVENEVDEIQGFHISEFGRCFDCGNRGWTKSPEANLMYLRSVQLYMNEKLRANGYLFLNEVYRELGFPETQAGQVVGWVYDENDPCAENWVDFNIYNFLDCPDRRYFVNGEEATIWLDFNVDGYILERLS